MKDIEQELKQCELATPSDDLDRRIDQLIAHAPRPRWQFLSRPVALWQCAAACLVFAVLGHLASRDQAQPERDSEPPTTVYIIQGGPEIPRRAFDATAREGVFLGDPEKVRTYIITGDAESDGANT